MFMANFWISKSPDMAYISAADGGRYRCVQYENTG